MRHPLQRLALVAAGLSLVGCGPTVPLEASVRQPAVDVQYGAPDKTPAPRPPDADPGPGTTAPGFIGAPVALPPTRGPVTPSTAPSVIRPTPSIAPPLDPCPSATAGSSPLQEAPISVETPPKEGLYTFRRTGSFKATEPRGSDADLEAAPATPLSPVVRRLISKVTSEPTAAGPYITYDVTELADGATLATTTSYVIDPLGAGGTNNEGDADPGVRITSIVVEGVDAEGQQVREAFNPQPAIKIVDLPFRVQAETPQSPLGQRSRGSDPLTGATMEVFRQTRPRQAVDVCGTVVDAWPVKIGDPEDPARQASFTNANGRAYQFFGQISFAPQLGMIIADDLTLGGPGRLNFNEGGRRFFQTSVATLSSTRPS